MHWRQPWSLALLLTGGIALVSCSPPTASRAGATADKGRAVSVIRVEFRPMERLVTVTGSLQSREEATLSVKVPGRLRTVNVDLGSVVKAGETIAQIEPADYEIRLRQAEAAVAQARAALGLPLDGTNDTVEVESTSLVRQAKALFEEASKNRQRMRDLAASQLVAASELDTTEAAYKVAENRQESAVEEARSKVATIGQRRAELALAQRQLADTLTRAPFDGIVQRREASPGEYVSVGTPIVTLVQPDPLRLRLEIPEREASNIRHGQKLRLQVEGHTNRWHGRLDRLSPALNEANRMLVVEADIPAGDVLRPGLFVRAEIVVTENDPGLAVPLSSVLAFAGLEKVVAVEEGKAVERTVSTGRQGPGWIEVTAGLKSGEQVILEPGGLRTGQSVVVTNDPGKGVRTESSGEWKAAARSE